MSNIVFPNTLAPGTPEDITDVDGNLQAIRAVVNGLLDGANVQDGTLGVDEISAAFAAFLGVSNGGVVRRGKSIVATEEGRTNAAFGLLTTPDRVSSVVLPTDGLIRITFHALAKQSAATAQAALFLGANQLKRSVGGAGGAPANQAAALGGTNRYQAVHSGGGGLYAVATGGTDESTVATGQIIGGDAGIGGSVVVFAAAGTYDVSVQWLCSGGGTVTAKERKLLVETVGF